MQAAELTEQKQAESAQQQQILREQLVGAIAQRLHQPLNLEEILTTTVAEVRQFIACNRVVIFRLHEDGSGIILVESVEPNWRSISGSSINDRYFVESYVKLYQQGRVQAVADIYRAGLTPCHVDLLARFQVRANLVVPIVQEEKLWGLLVAQQCSRPREWQPWEIDLLKSFSTQVAIAIYQSELYQQAQSEIKQRQQAEQLLRQQFQREHLVAAIAQRIRQSLNLDEILQATVAEVQQVLACDRVVIFRFEPDWSGQVVVESVDEGWSAILGQNIYDPCFKENYISPYREGRVRAIGDIYRANLGVCHINLLAQFQVRANLVVPIIQSEPILQPSESKSQSRLWGLLIAHQCSEARKWQQCETDLLCSLASQVAIAIQQAELYKQSRTAEANARKQAQQLEEALAKLQRTQTQLVQSEKMSSLGQLVAGIAHEINNPVNFIYGNLTYASEYTQDILSLLKRYQQHYPNPTPDIRSEITRIDLDFLLDDLPKLLDSMKVGAERISEIVRSLRNFSRFSEAEMKAVDIHEGLDSTLMILQSRLKPQGKYSGIQVIKEYGNLPKVECYAGQLNQVFMNILVNAIDALEAFKIADELDGEGDAPIGATPDAFSSLSHDSANMNRQRLTSPMPWIRISTEILNNDQVVIRIADNGPGITAKVKQQLFEPFFTTKPVGTGTGLGLFISYQIVVEKHGGQLDCFSQLGQGTEFVIQIPRWQNTPVK